MNARKKVSATKACALATVGLLPLLLYAHALGPDPRKTGAPGDSTCNEAGCHVGTPLNGGGGRVEITFPNGMTYVPGETQRWTVTVTDSAARRFGFQATARLASAPSTGQAGNFTTADTRTQVLCDDGSIKTNSGSCRTGFPVQFIEHSNANSTNTFTFNWTAPSTNVGDVKVYVAGNGANGDQNNTGDHIYTASYTLTASAGSANKPTIAAGGVADAFNYQKAVSPNSWIAIVGTNFGSTTTTWDSFVQGTQLPTTIQGVSVTIDGKAATVFFISPTQINVLAPLGIGTGNNIPVVVKTADGQSDPFMVTAGAALPAFYAPFADSTGKFFVTAVSLTGEYLGKTGLDPRVTRAARPGEIIQVFGSGFGATTPAAPTDRIVSGAPEINTTWSVRVNNQPATLLGKGNLVAAGLYQFNLTVPNGLADGDYQIVAEAGGVSSPTTVYLSVKR